MQISCSKNQRAALYIRLSKEDGGENESASVGNQRSLLLAFAAEQRLIVHDVYVDDGYSGTSFERPAFQRLLTDIEAGKVDMVITKDMSRLGRDYIQTGYYLERYFPEKGVRYISLLDGVDTGADSNLNDITPFKAVINDMYAKDISRKITSVKRDKQKKGLFIGGKAPYGYKLSPAQKNMLLVDEEAAAVVRRIFALAVTGKSCREIATLLNSEGLPSPAVYAGLREGAPGPYSGQWSSERVNFMLKNETYLGHMVQGRRQKINYKLKKSRRLPPSEWTVVENTHEALVDEEVFSKVGQLIESRRHTRVRSHDYLLKGLIHCHECGHPLGVISRTLSGGRSALYFICRTYQRFTKRSLCSCHCARVEAVTEAVLDLVREMCRQALDDEECVRLLARAAAEARNQDIRGQELARARKRLGVLTAQLDKMYGDKLCGLLVEEDFQRFYRQALDERVRLRERLATLEKPTPAGFLPVSAPDELRQRFIDEAEHNRELVVSLIERIELSEDKELRVYFRCRPLAESMRLP